jgi:mono/diheme cytochrome c family protein
MYNQARYKPYAATDFFDDGTSARPLVFGTVPHSDVRGGTPEPSELFLTGKTAGKLAESFPMPIDRGVLERGQERYRIFCTPCHGELGDGRGIVVRRGFAPPPTYHSDELRGKPPGHFVDVITRGFGAMSSYAARVPPRDRWAITAYIRALQLSQHALVAELAPEDRRQLEEARP